MVVKKRDLVTTRTMSFFFDVLLDFSRSEGTDLVVSSTSCSDSKSLTSLGLFNRRWSEGCVFDKDRSSSSDIFLLFLSRPAGDSVLTAEILLLLWISHLKSIGTRANVYLFQEIGASNNRNEQSQLWPGTRKLELLIKATTWPSNTPQKKTSEDLTIWDLM